MNSDNDDKLKAFMKNHSPVAPPAPRDELARLQKSVGSLQLQTPQRRSLYNRWFAMSGAGALVASFAASWFLLSGPNPDSTSIRLTSEEWAVHVLSGDQDDEAVPTNEVGEEYLGLLAGR
jgi:hypothetical protein